MRKLKFIKAEPIGKVNREDEIFTLNIGKTDFSIKLAVKNYWLLYGKEDLFIQVNTDTQIIQELMRYPFKIEVIK